METELHITRWLLPSLEVSLASLSIVVDMLFPVKSRFLRAGIRFVMLPCILIENIQKWILPPLEVSLASLSIVVNMLFPVKPRFLRAELR